jgi:hypothetical protein
MMIVFFGNENVMPMDFEMDGEKILFRLRESLGNGTVIGVCAPEVLGNGIFTTTVEKISLSDDGFEVCLKEYDSTGYILPRRRLKLYEIEKVCVFSSQMDNPYLKEFTGNIFHRIIK